MVCENSIKSGEKIDTASITRAGGDVKCSGNYPKMDSRIDKNKTKVNVLGFDKWQLS